MIKIGETIILSDGETPYKGECTADVINRANNIISIVRDEETKQETIQIIKLRYRHKFEELNERFIGGGSK
jgi:hypothetical protein